MKSFFTACYALVLLILLNGCSFLAPTPSQNINLYWIHANNDSVAKTNNHKTMLVMATQANAPFDTNKMVYVLANHQLGYFAKNAWASSPSQMLSDNIALALRNHGHFRAIVSAPFSGNTDYRFSSQLLAFQQEYIENQSFFHLTLAAQVISNQNNSIVRSKQWDIKIPCANNPYSGQLAAQLAVKQLLNQLIIFSDNL